MMSQNTATTPPLIYKLTNTVLFLAGTFNLSIGTWYASQTNTSIAATSLTAGLVLLFASTIDRFESLKGLGIEAKTRKLDEKIAEADEALRGLRKLAELTGSTLIDMDSKIGRWGSAPSHSKMYANAEQTRRIMEEFGSEPTIIKNALLPWAEIFCFDLSIALTNPLNVSVDCEITRLRAFLKDTTYNSPEYQRLTEEINPLSTFKEQRQNFSQHDLNDYPECFMGLFNPLPNSIQKEHLILKEKMEFFAADMLVLKNSMVLPNPEK